MRTPQQIRQHLVEVERAMRLAVECDACTEALLQEYLRASRDVAALDANEAEFRLPSSRAEVACG